MPAPRPFIGEKDLHLIGKLLDVFDDEMLEKAGLSSVERARADWMFDDINNYLDEKLGLDWNDQGVE